MRNARVNAFICSKGLVRAEPDGKFVPSICFGQCGNSRNSETGGEKILMK